MAGTLGSGLGVYIPLYILLGIYAAAIAAVAWKPCVSLYMLVLFIPLETTRAKVIGLPLGAQMIDILWISAFLGMMLRKDGPLVPKARIKGYLVALAIVTYLSLWQGWFYVLGDPPIFPSDPRFSNWKNYMVMPLIAITTAAVLREVKQIKIVVLLIVVATFLVDSSFIRSTSGRDFSHFNEATRDAGVLGYSGVNGMGAFCAQMIPFMVALWFLLPNKKYRLILATVIGYTGYSLLFSFSRGGYAACLAGIAIIALFRQRSLLIGIVVLLIAWQTILPAAVQERINMTYDGSSQELEPSAEARVTLWEDALSLIEKNPASGTGFDTYEFMHRVGPYKDTHNYYMKVAVEEGLIGLFLLLAIFFQLWKAGYQLLKTAEDDPFLTALGLGFAAMIVALFVANIFGDRWTYLPVAGFMWVLLGCVIRGLEITRRNHEEKALAESSAAVEGDLVAV